MFILESQLIREENRKKYNANIFDSLSQIHVMNSKISIINFYLFAHRFSASTILS